MKPVSLICCPDVITQTREFSPLGDANSDSLYFQIAIHVTQWHTHRCEKCVRTTLFAPIFLATPSACDTVQWRLMLASTSRPSSIVLSWISRSQSRPRRNKFNLAHFQTEGFSFQIKLVAFPLLHDYRRSFHQVMEKILIWFGKKNLQHILQFMLVL